MKIQNCCYQIYNLAPDTCLSEVTSKEVNLLVGGRWVRKSFCEAGMYLPDVISKETNLLIGGIWLRKL